jgi:pimeloyl-ACP methyl ester carboxylesterase
MKRKLLIVAAGCFALVLAGAWVCGTVMTNPARRAVGELPPDLRGRAVEFGSPSGATIRGWLLPGKKGAGAVALMHGIGGSRLDMVPRARLLSAAGYTVLLFDFQAHGESAGERITVGYLESRDARAAVEFLRESAPGERVGIVGVSMGGAAALLASPPVEAQAVVLEMVYPTIEQAVSNRLTMRLGGWAGALTPLLTAQLRPRLGFGPEDLRPVARVGELRMPKLFIAGAEDRHTTLRESEQLFEAAAEPKEFWAVEGAAHVDLYTAAGREYERRVLGFLGRHLRQER